MLPNKGIFYRRANPSLRVDFLWVYDIIFGHVSILPVIMKAERSLSTVLSFVGYCPFISDRCILLDRVD